MHGSRSSPILFYNSWKVCCRLFLCKLRSTGHCCCKHYRTHSLCLSSLYTRNVVKSTGESGVRSKREKKPIWVQKRNGCETAVTSTTLHFLFSFRKNTAPQSQLTWRCVRRELNICLCMSVCVCVIERETGTEIETAGKLKCPLCWNLPDGTGQKQPGVLLPHTHTFSAYSVKRQQRQE